MLTFIIPLLLGSIIGFLIRGKPSESFVISGRRRAAWAIGVGFIGLVIGLPIGLGISQSTAPQIAGLIGGGLGLGVLNVLSIRNLTYKLWHERNVVLVLTGTTVALVILSALLSDEIRGLFPRPERNADYLSSSQGTPPNVMPRQDNINGLPTSYLGVSLGASALEAKYTLGMPKSSGSHGFRGSHSKDEQYQSIAWGDNAEYIVWLNKLTNKVEGIGCNLWEKCPPLLGIKIGDDEATVLASLPSDIQTVYTQEGARDLISKRITLKRNTTVSFALLEKRVVLIRLYSKDVPLEFVTER